MIRRSVSRMGRLGKIVRPDLTPERREQVVAQRLVDLLDDTEVMRVRETVERIRSARRAVSQPAPEAAQEQAEEEAPPAPLPPQGEASPQDEAPTQDEADAGELQYRKDMERRQAWIDEHVRWRPRGEPDPYYWDGDDGDDPNCPYGRVIVDYDPFDPRYDYDDWDR